jgi:hypothetical protein
MWFLTQHKRWGLLKSDPDYLAVAKAINRIDIYKQAATAAGVALPKSDMRSHKLIDGVVWDGKDPQKYAPVREGLGEGGPRNDRFRDLAKVIIPPLFGIALMLGIWALVAIKSGNIPGPDKTWAAALKLFADPFYQNGPNDQGIGWNVLSSLQRVGIGFGFAAAIGIPLGFMLGRFVFMNACSSPIIAAAPGLARWPGCRSACWCSRRPTRRRPGPFSSARSGR